MLIKCFVYGEISAPQWRWLCAGTRCISMHPLTGGGRDAASSISRPPSESDAILQHARWHSWGVFSGSKLTETCVQRKECGKIMKARQSRLFRPPHLLTCKFWACVVVKHPMPWKTQKFCPQVIHDLRLDCVSVCVGHQLWEHKGQIRNILVEELILDQLTFTQCREGKSDLWKQLLLQLYRWLCAEG